MLAEFREPSQSAARRSDVAILFLVGSLTLGMVGYGGIVSPPTPQVLTFPINPNHASAIELQLLPRIGPKRAADIIEYRESVSGHAFQQPSDLTAIRGIGPVTVTWLEPHLVFEPHPHQE